MRINTFFGICLIIGLGIIFSIPMASCDDNNQCFDKRGSEVVCR